MAGCCGTDSPAVPPDAVCRQALADFHRAYDSDPSNTTTKRRLAVVHDQFGVRLFNDGLVAQAEVEFSTAIEYNPGVALFHLHRGNAAMYLQVRHALRWWRDAHASDLTRALRCNTACHPRRRKWTWRTGTSRRH